MIEHGLGSPLWGARKIITMSHPLLLKKAVIDVIDHLEQVDASGTSPFEIIDRLIQVSSEGKYSAPSREPETRTVASFTLNEDGTLSPEQQEEMQKFIQQLNGIPDAEKMDGENESYPDFLKRLGIPDINDFQEDEDDDPQPE